jgi:ketose-bisphosphate aldolase
MYKCSCIKIIILQKMEISKNMKTNEIVKIAWKNGFVIPAFNIPYLPMMEPVVKALQDTQCFGLVMVARLEWVKFQSKSLKAIRDEYEKCKDIRYTRLHLDHVPVIDEDNLKIDFVKEIGEAINLGYESVMVDGSRLPFKENILQTRKITALAHQADVPVEAELGAVMGHEDGPMPDYETLFQSGKGFTSPAEARIFVAETQADWLSVAIGNIHGAISVAKKNDKKVEARLNIEHLNKINQITNIPLVLHGGTGIRKQYILDSFKNGIAKINIATAIRQPYELLMNKSVKMAQDVVYATIIDLINNELEINGTALKLI